MLTDGFLILDGGADVGGKFFNDTVISVDLDGSASATLLPVLLVTVLDTVLDSGDGANFIV